MKIRKPLHDRVLLDMIEVKAKEKTTAGGIIYDVNELPVNEYHTVQGYIVQLGEFAFQDYKDAGFEHPKVGDKVVITKYAGNNYEDGEVGKDFKVYRLVRDIEIQGVIDAD